MKITTVSVSDYGDEHATCWMHRGDDKCRMYSNVTNSSLKRMAIALENRRKARTT